MPRGLTDWHTLPGATPDDFDHPHDAPHPPRAYYAGAEPGGIDGTYDRDVRPGMSPGSLRAAVLLAVIPLALVALVAWMVTHASDAPQTPGPQTAPLVTEIPNPIQPHAPDQPQVPDAYDAWLRLKPAGALDLSREDAMTRAVLGCGVRWPAGTVDAALQAAYGPTLCQGR